MAGTIDTSTADLRSHALSITDELARAASFILAAHMAANAIDDCAERDALQEVLDEAERRVLEAKRLASECVQRRAA